jgi:3-oxoacyl-(acyl-carrier-protein) synthase
VTPRVVTGLGIASALGTGAEAFFEGMRAPERLSNRPQAPVASFDATKYDRPLPLAEVPGFDPAKYLGDKGLRVLDRLTKLLVVAARLCLKDAGLKSDGQWTALGPERVGVCCSNAYGSLEAITELDRVAVLEDARYINPAKFPNTVSNSASGYVSIWEDLRALNVTVSDGNCGALDAVACADVFLATERAEAILTGGGEAMSEALFLAFERLGALGDGRLGEGAAFLALESREAARARGARALGEIAGYGTAFVAPLESTLVFASREAVARAAAQALEEAGVAPGDVDVVASSVSGLRRFDAEELAAIADVVPGAAVAAPKLVLGETLGACGALGAAAAIAWLAGAPPSPLVRGAAPAKVDTVLVTSIGYYGNASAVVVRRA